jgi:hypothetical protein
MLSQLDKVPKRPEALVAALQGLPRPSETFLEDNFSPPNEVMFNLLVKLHRLSELEMDFLRLGRFRFLRTPGRKSFRLVLADKEDRLP